MWFYRKWSKEGTLTTASQLKAIKILTMQFEIADIENKPIIALGDANLCFHQNGII